MFQVFARTTGIGAAAAVAAASCLPKYRRSTAAAEQSGVLGEYDVCVIGGGAVGLVRASLLFLSPLLSSFSFLYLTSITIPFPTQFRLVRVKLWDGIHQRPSLSWKRKPAQQHTKPVTTRAYVKIYFTAQI